MRSSLGLPSATRTASRSRTASLEQQLADSKQDANDVYVDYQDAVKRLHEAERENRELRVAEENLADYAKRYFELFDMYMHSWLRNIGGVIRPKHHQIDGFALRTEDIYQKAKLVDRIKVIILDQLNAKATAEQMYDAVFRMLAEDGHDKVPTN